MILMDNIIKEFIFLNKNKESLTAKGFNELALAVLPELEYVSVDPITLEADDILSEYF